MNRTVYTVGHSNRSLAEFVEILRAHGIAQILDVRSIPRSRHNPQFNKDVLGRALRARRIGYRPRKKLGGLRSARKDSKNTGWRNASFRGYADYMQTADFRRGIEQLKKTARRKKTALMCAEAVPWRCHRSLIGDWMEKIEGWRVLDIFSAGPARPHKPVSFARKRGQSLLYK